MKNPQYYEGSPVFTLTDQELQQAAEGGFGLTKIDLQNTPWRHAAAIQLNAKTVSNQNATGSVLLMYAFSREDISAVSGATMRLSTRATTLTLALPTGIDGDTEREFVSARIPVQARYLYLYWNATTTSSAVFDLEVHAIPVA
ncbi:MAG: hypothetical protein K0Q55_1947 [Verrucomicrobia bacterium]|nr:hypothetical protein [Verrucomicrobiota bacterium]